MAFLYNFAITFGFVCFCKASALSNPNEQYGKLLSNLLKLNRDRIQTLQNHVRVQDPDLRVPLHVIPVDDGIRVIFAADPRLKEKWMPPPETTNTNQQAKQNLEQLKRKILELLKRKLRPIGTDNDFILPPQQKKFRLPTTRKPIVTEKPLVVMEDDFDYKEFIFAPQENKFKLPLPTSKPIVTTKKPVTKKPLVMIENIGDYFDYNDFIFPPQQKKFRLPLPTSKPIVTTKKPVTEKPLVMIENVGDDFGYNDFIFAPQENKFELPLPTSKHIVHTKKPVTKKPLLTIENIGDYFDYNDFIFPPPQKNRLPLSTWKPIDITEKPVTETSNNDNSYHYTNPKEVASLEIIPLKNETDAVENDTDDHNSNEPLDNNNQDVPNVRPVTVSPDSDLISDSSDNDLTDGYALIIDDNMGAEEIDAIEILKKLNLTQKEAQFLLRSWHGSCADNAKKVCYKACKSAVKNYCSSFDCKHGKLKFFKKECKKSCSQKFPS